MRQNIYARGGGFSDDERALSGGEDMTRWSLVRVAATVIALMLLALPVRAQLPTMSDVDRGGEPRAAGPLPEWDVAVVKPHPVEDHMMRWQVTADGMTLVNLPLELAPAWPPLGRGSSSGSACPLSTW